MLDEGTSIIIFPESSHDGYHDELTKFFPGFVTLAHSRLRKGEDLPIYLCYLNKYNNTCFVDKPILSSQLASLGETKEEIAEVFRNRCNELGKMSKEYK